jgi:hypothetical protein
MASFQTFFRVVVMLATLGLLAKAWFLYGPTVDELQTIGSRVAELAEKAWADYWQTPGNNSSLADDPRLPTTGAVPAPFVPSDTPMQPIPTAPRQMTSAPATGAVQLAGGVPAEIVPVTPSLSTQSSPWPTNTSVEPALVPIETPTPTQDARLPAMFDRLTQLGARDQQLAP